jgi:hypothetical protein
MALYKDKNGNLHDDDSGKAFALFPASLGPYAPVTDDEAAAIRLANFPKVDPKAEALGKIAALEEIQIKETARMIRERTLEEAEALALSQFNLTPEQLYAIGAAANPPTAALNYKRLKDLDNAIKIEREKIA